MKPAILKSGRDKSLRRRHPWIFSGALASLSPATDGELFEVHSAEGEFLALAHLNQSSSLAGRVISFEKGEIGSILRQRLLAAASLRSFSNTDGYRLVNSEGDFLPGLIIDRYRDILVFQIGSEGMERLKPLLITLCVELFSPKTIYEKSSDKILWGENLQETEFLENGLRFAVSFPEGQKTGFFFDQREMRSLIETLSSGKRVLNLFSYTGGFSLYALRGGASHVVSVDSDAKANRLAHRNTLLNQFSPEKHQIITADAFDFLHSSPLDFDLIIVDPPAFAKKRDDLQAACRGYKEINRTALQKMAPGSILLTSSCSYWVGEPLFSDLLAQSAAEARCDVQILEKHRQAHDHPTSLCHPEGAYLKSLLLRKHA